MTDVADAETRQLISRAGLERTLFVEAGAGTGKTTQLVGRVVNLVVEAGVRLTDIAAITFTEAAATELADRIRVEFERRAATEADPEVVERCHRAVADADLAAISTLHGFAKRVLSEHPVAAGLPPRVDILDEVSSQLAQEDRWERFVDALYDDPDHTELLVRAALLDVALEPRYKGHATMKDVAGALSQNWDRLDAVAAHDHGPLPPIELGHLRRRLAELEELLAHCAEPDDKLLRRLEDELLPAMRHIAGLGDDHRALRALADVRKPWSASRVGRKPAWGCDVQAVRDAVAAVEEARLAAVAPVVEDVLRRLLGLVSREVLAAADARRREGHLEFHDLLVLARRLLRSSPATRAALHRRYQRLLLDEFQDTDPIQIELAVLIASAVEGGEPPSWDQVAVGEGRLFFVGDPKQSIYRFRRADIGLFLAARDRFAPDQSWQRLITNFRTVPEVVAWNNALFSMLMAEEVPGSQPRYQALVAARPSAPDGDHRPVLLGHAHPKADKLKADELRRLEAADVARAIDDVRSQPEAWPVHDGEGRWRPARLPDITVLVPTRTSLPFLRDALRALGIPHRLDTGTLVYSTQEVHDALAALRAVDDPGDALSLVTALRSPLYACSDPDLFTWHHAGGRWDLRATTPPGDLTPEHPVASALAHLRTLWEQRWWSGPSDLLVRLLDERHGFLLAFGHDRPAEVWRRLRFLIDQARAFEEAGGGDLRGFLAWADLQGAEGSRVHEPLLPETDDVAVRIMTVHGSKGLEFPITILSGMTTRPSGGRRGVSLLWDAHDVPELKMGSRLATENYDPRADIEDQMDVHEKLRLLYVACTRARDHLIVACHHNAGDGSYAQRVWDHCQEVGDGWRTLPPMPVPPVGGPAVQQSLTLLAPAPDDAAEWWADREAVLEPQRHPRVVSATTLAGQAAAAEDLAQPEADAGGPTPDEVDDGPDDRGGRPPLLPRRRGRAGTAIGRAVHATLQLIDLGRLAAPDAPGDLERLAARQAEIEAVPSAAPTVAAMVRSALDAPTIRAAAALAHHKEVYVAARIGERLIEGYVDLLVEGPDGLVVIDYKTDTVRGEADVDAKLAAYELQGAAYAVALEASTGLSVVDCRFVFCRPGGAIERSVADLAGVKGRVRRHLEDPAPVRP